MKANDWEKIKDLFALVLEQPETGRAEFLAASCAGDGAMRAEIESLLKAYDETKPFIERSDYGASVLLVTEEDAGEDFYAGKQFGHYRIEREIGRGGMGAVFLAERSDGEFSQQVALKIVRRSFADRELGKRFRQERQILASLNHPNIAKLLDGGVSQDGEPFLAMEYVEGKRIDDYCVEKNLSTRERLKLFLAVCKAVAFAHQNLIVHRDLKPSNILVGKDGAVKLLDFGIAKLIDSENADEQTRTAFRAFTPEYAAPEQIAGERITTAADVFSLGVLLEDLLRGAHFSASAANNSAGKWQSAKIANGEVGETDSSDGAANKTVAANLPTYQENNNPKSKIQNPKSLDGELKNIIAMARREEPARRYASVSQFAEDVERYLDGLPVRARQSSFSYRAEKFVGRNKAAIFAAAFVFLAIVSGLGVSLWQTENARRQRDLAQAEKMKAERINGFLREMLSFSNQSYTSVAPVPGTKNVTVNEMLDKIAPRIESELAGEPEVRAQVLRTVGSSYASQGLYENAEKFLREALNTQIEIFGEDDDETAATMVELGLLNLRQAKYAEADKLLEKAVAFYRRRQQENSPQFSPAKLIRATDYWGTNKIYTGETKTALSILEEAMEYADSANVEGVEREAVAGIEQDFGVALVTTGDLEKGETFVRRAVDRYRQISTEPRWELGNAVNSLGVCLFKRNKTDEALPFLTEAEQILRQTLGEKNLYLATNLNWQARVLNQKNDLQTAELKVRAALSIYQNLYPTTNAFSSNSFVTLGNILTKTKRAREAENLLRQTLASLEALPTKNHPFIVPVKIGLSESLLAQNRAAEAERIALDARDEAAQNLGEQSLVTKTASDNLTKIYEKKGKSDLAQKSK